VARLHEAFEAGATSKVFASTAFGYRRITVERPLRLRFSVTPETLAAYQAIKGAEQAEAFAILADSGMSWDDLASFLKAAKVKKLGKGALKALFATIGTKCPEASIVTDADNKPVADSDLRENENVPLGQDIREYFAREVLPHVPDAWIDETKRDEKDGLVGIVGYEINFNRYFYQYQPPRSLSDIDADLKAVEAEIAALLGQVTE
jgi:type I restriction enzyme M protein